MLKIGKIRSASTTFTLLYLIYAAGEFSSKLVFFSSDYLFLFLIKDYVKGFRFQGLEGVLSCVGVTMFWVMVMAQAFLALRLWMRLNPLRTRLDFFSVSFNIRLTCSPLVPLNFVTGRREETRWDPFETSV